MDQSVSFFTVATADLNAAWTFYVEGLGWEPAMKVPGEVIFFQIAPGVMLGFFDGAMFAEDMNAPKGSGAAPCGFTLAHNVQSEAEVDRILAAAAGAGAAILKPGQHASFGGYHGHFQDPIGVVWEIAHNPGWRVDEKGKVFLV
ncbi:VOC family protein [soil metagenome]